MGFVGKIYKLLKKLDYPEVGPFIDAWRLMGRYERVLWGRLAVRILKGQEEHGKLTKTKIVSNDWIYEMLEEEDDTVVYMGLNQMQKDLRKGCDI